MRIQCVPHQVSMLWTISIAIHNRPIFRSIWFGEPLSKTCAQVLLVTRNKLIWFKTLTDSIYICGYVKLYEDDDDDNVDGDGDGVKRRQFYHQNKELYNLIELHSSERTPENA